jgi:hypothetical protein
VVSVVVDAAAIAANDNWRNLSPKEKDKVIRNYERWKNFRRRTKRHLREEWNRFQRLPQDRRDRLKQRYDDQTAQSARRLNQLHSDC